MWLVYNRKKDSLNRKGSIMTQYDYNQITEDILESVPGSRDTFAFDHSISEVAVMDLTEEEKLPF